MLNMAEAVKSILGTHLQGKKGKIAAESLVGEGKVVGLYFSAHWCPPCRNFTPKLVEFYRKIRERRGDVLEIVFISSDSDESQFESYYEAMPWVALPFSERRKKNNLGTKFNVTGIPKLVLLDGKDGSLITEDGRKKLTEDFEGLHFPWRS